MENNSAISNAKQAAFALGAKGLITSISAFGGGHINDTYKIVADENGKQTPYILQRVNTHVFKNHVQLMENIDGVTSYMREQIAKEGGDPTRETLTFLKTSDGKSFYENPESGVWRMYYFVDDCFCYDRAETPELFAASARAFGRFVMRLKDYPAHTLHETIKDFHNTPVRYQNFVAALDEDACKRAQLCQKEIEFIKSREKDCALLTNLLKNGQLPLRVTHNDTKLNNVLIDRETNEGLCVIDLDTVMPGLAASDFGDAIRFGASTAVEDEQDLSKVNFSLSLYNTYKQNYLAACGEALTEKEIETLPLGAKLMTLECGMRFLADYLQGDIYFKTKYPEHNLVRCRTQLKLVADMEAVWDKL